MAVEDAIRAELDRLSERFSFLKQLLRCNADRIGSLVFFIEELIRWNKRLRLTGAFDGETVVKRHLADVIALVDVLHRLHGADLQAKTAIDVGTGGGWPSLPAAIFCDQLPIIAVEASSRKCSFLRTIISRLDLSITLVNQRIETLVQHVPQRDSGVKIPEHFDIAWSLATFVPNQWLRLAASLVAKNAVVVGFFSKKPIDVSITRAYDLAEELAYDLVDGRSRTLTVWQRL